MHILFTWLRGKRKAVFFLSALAMSASPLHVVNYAVLSLIKGQQIHTIV
jgi:hypothetical protein